MVYPSPLCKKNSGDVCVGMLQPEQLMPSAAHKKNGAIPEGHGEDKTSVPPGWYGSVVEYHP